MNSSDVTSGKGLERRLEIVVAERRSTIRNSSTVSFPYADLAEVQNAVQIVASSGGHCMPQQLAPWLGHSTLRSGAFRNKVAAAKLFGVLSGSRNLIMLTDLGERLVRDGTARQAKVDAFLSVPLYRQSFERYSGAKLPGSKDLELEFLRRGVSRTQLTAARQVFLRSAEQAGFFESGDHRLVLPLGTDLPGSSVSAARSGTSTRTPNAVRLGNPESIETLLMKVPWNNAWSEAELQEWLALFTSAIRVHFKLPNNS